MRIRLNKETASHVVEFINHNELSHMRIAVVIQALLQEAINNKYNNKEAPSNGTAKQKNILLTIND